MGKIKVKEVGKLLLLESVEKKKHIKVFSFISLSQFDLISSGIQLETKVH